MKFLLLLLCFATGAFAVESKKAELPALPTTVTLIGGLSLQNVSATKWNRETVVLKHARGIDPIAYTRFAPADRAIFEQWRDAKLAEQNAATVARNKAEAEAQSAQLAQEAAARELRKKYEDLAAAHKIAVGMPEDLLIKSWGNPEKRNVSSHGSDQWVYRLGTYVYVENGKVSSWQDHD